MFLAMLFGAAASVNDLVLIASADTGAAVNATMFGYGRALTYGIMHVYALR